MKKILTIILTVIVFGGIFWYLYALSQTGAKLSIPASPALTLAQVESVTNNSIVTDTNNAPLAAFGDLTGDGAGDAAVIVPNLTNSAGNILEIFALSTSTSLTENGQPVLIATTSDFRVPSALGDLGMGTLLNPITTIAINNGGIALGGQTSASGASATSVTATIQYKIVSGVLVKNGPPFSIPSLPTGVSAIGTGASWGTYTDTADGVSFDYPSGVVNLSTKSSDIKQIKSYLPIDPSAKAVLTLPPSQYPASTTVHDIAVTFATFSAPDFSSCSSAAQGDYKAAPVETPIMPPSTGLTSAVNFYQLPGVTSGGCWAGGCAYGTLFITYQNGICYQFGLQAAVTDPGAIVTSQSQFQQMDKNNQVFESRVAALFYQILSTIRFR